MSTGESADVAVCLQALAGRNWNSAGALRRLHDVMAACDVQPEQRDDPWKTPGQLAAQLQADAPKLLERARQLGVPIEQHLQRAAAVLEILGADETLNRCPRHLTHGDFQGRNLLVRGDTLAGIIDFERLERRPLLYDLAWPFVFWRCFGTDAGAYTEADWQYARACCSAYAAALPAPLSAETWGTLPLLMAYIPARGVAEAEGEDDPLAEIEAFGVALEFALWLARHPEAALSRLRG